MDLLPATVEITGCLARPAGDVHHIRRLEAAGGDGGSTHPDAAGDEGLLRVQRRKMLYGILDDYAKLLFAKKMLHIAADVI